MKSNQNLHLINVKLILVRTNQNLVFKIRRDQGPLCRWATIIENCLYDNFWSSGPIKAHDILLWLLEHQDLFCITNLKI